MDEMDHSSGHDAKRKEKIPSAEGRGWSIRTEEADLLDNVPLNSPLVGHLMNQLPTILAMEILGIRRRRPAQERKRLERKTGGGQGDFKQKQQHEKNQQQQKLTVIIQPLRP